MEAHGTIFYHISLHTKKTKYNANTRSHLMNPAMGEKLPKVAPQNRVVPTTKSQRTSNITHYTIFFFATIFKHSISN